MFADSIIIISSLLAAIRDQRINDGDNPVHYLFGYACDEGWVCLNKFSLTGILNYDSPLLYYAIAYIDNAGIMQIEYFGLSHRDLSGNDDFNTDESYEFFESFFGAIGELE